MHCCSRPPPSTLAAQEEHAASRIQGLLVPQVRARLSRPPPLELAFVPLSKPHRALRLCCALYAPSR